MRGVALAAALALSACAARPMATRAPTLPSTGRVCDASGCLRFEARGTAHRDARGLVDDAVVVLSAFGFDEHVDGLWPQLVAAGHALDPSRHLVVGVAAARDDAGRLPSPAAFVRLLDTLLTQRGLAREALLVGASSYGAELALRALAVGVTRGAVVVCGGHDRPWAEPPMQRVRDVLAAGIAARDEPRATWRAVVLEMLPASYTPEYLADPRRAAERGVADTAARVGLAAAIFEDEVRSLTERVSLADLAARMAAAFALEPAPLVYPRLDGRRVELVANRDDRMMSFSQVSALADRLRAHGARVTLHAFSDDLGHSVFFGRTPAALEAAIDAALAPAAR